MHSVIEGDKDAIEEGKLIMDSINQSMFSFNPDMIYENLVKDYRMAKHIYGDSFLREITGEDESSLKRNLNIPEFQRMIKKKIVEKLEKLKEKDLINKELEITQEGFYLGSLTLYLEELDNLKTKGIVGERRNKKESHYGNKKDYKNYKKGDRFKDLALKKSIKRAIRRNHDSVELKDLYVFDRESKGKVYLIYALDASGSMKGNKIKLCKKAGVALAFKAINEHDKVGLLIFGKGVRNEVMPTTDFSQILNNITKVGPKKETDIVSTIRKAVEMFPEENVTKHLILITDGVPTVGEDPEEETVESVAIASNSGVSVSVIGINLDEKGESIAKRIVEAGNGRLYVVKNLENLDSIVLEDYYQLK